MASEKIVRSHIASHSDGKLMPRGQAPQKVDQDGTYLPFAGVSVVCNVLPSEPWTRLPDIIENVAGRWLSPLPTSSYHATLLAGPCQARLRLDDVSWEAYLKTRREEWAKLDCILQEASFAPSSLHFVGMRDLDRWGLCVDLIVDDPVEDGASRRLRSILRASAPTCGFEARERPWHVTLAYRRSRAGKIPAEVAEEVRRLVDTCLLETLALRPAQLCFHPDMTAFYPLTSLNMFGETISQMSTVAHVEGEQTQPEKRRRWRRL